MISSFSGEYRFLSNFFQSVIKYEGLTFLSVEAAYQASKSLDPEIRKCFVGINPGAAKKLGQRVELREDWEQVKFKVMAELLILKFKDPWLQNLLLQTYPESLVEGNTWGDRIWGVCDGTGENRLGRLLEEVRLKYLKERDSLST